ncbi:MAG: NAD(P)H-hydrate dehydratase [Parvularculaceae bacterium]|nr:NAD(P)H-hydrate dehydratase [Parvularculaceae bacterium]
MTPPFILTAAETARAEQLAAAGGVPSLTLMETAGGGVAAAAAKFWPKGPVAVLCGPGNNGGDGFVAARLLAEQGWPVRTALLGDRNALKGDAKTMAERNFGPIEDFSPAALSGATLIIDALFGTGLSRPVEGPAAAMIDAANAHAAPVLAVDVPSGVNADTGAVMGTAIRAARTATFFTKKPAHMLFPGRAFCGAVDVVDIGIPVSVLAKIAPSTYENQPEVWAAAFRRPSFTANKFSRGHVAVVSGPRLRTGAARLAARAALRSGAGLVTLLADPEAADECAAQATSVMVRVVDGARGVAAALADPRITAAVIGPAAGIGPATVETTQAILNSSVHAVLDADVFSSFEARPDTLFSRLRPNDVLTPHEGEFGRLFKDIDPVTLGRLGAARLAAHRCGAVVALKGADTVVAAPDGRAAINGNAPPDLATAGSGDALAGMIAGQLAQGTPGFEAALIGVWLHGACGQAAGPGLIAEDLPDALPVILRRLLSPPTDPGRAPSV